MRKHLLLTAVVASLLSVVVNAASPFASQVLAAPAQQTPAFSPASCMFELPPGVVEGEDVVCGFVTVPEQHGVPDGPTIELAVVIIKSTDANPKPDPLFMAQGGPGGSTIDAYAERLLTDSRLRADRDIVLWDQRGTLYSKPNLYCQEYDQLVSETLEKDLSDDESRQLDHAALAACRARLEGDGINLSAFDSLENASDIEAIRQSLGYDQINLYGVSYGTLLAQHYMRMFPDSLRSVILDGVVPTQTNFVVNSAQTMNHSFKEFFVACQADPRCNRTYPDLEDTFYQVVDRLNETPARIQMVDTEGNKTYENAVINGDAFLNGLFQMLYAGSLIPALPRMIYDARDGNFDFFGRIFSILIFDRTTSYGMYFSVLCAEDSDFTPADQDLSGLPPQIVESEKGSPQDVLDSCKIWNVETFGPEVDQPVISDIPTLVLSGKFDPITPPAYAQAAASTLANSYNFVLPAGGHGQAMEGECEDNLILSFLENPNAQPDAYCLSNKNPIAFYTPATLVTVPGLVKLLNLEGSSGPEVLILLVSLFLLGSVIFALPFAWLVRRLSRKPAQQAYAGIGATLEQGALPDPPAQKQRAFLDRGGGWIAILAACVLAVLVVGLVVVLFGMIAENDTRLFFGLVGGARPLVFLAPLFALLALGMLIIAVVAWVRGFWSVWMRLYYSLITLAGLGALLVLVRWGLLFAPFS